MQEVVHNMVHNAYLFQRGKIFYFRWKVPVNIRPVLGRTEIRYSLFTDSLQKAKLRSGPFAAMVSETKKRRCRHCSFRKLPGKAFLVF